MSCLPGVWVYIVRFAGALDLARMEFWRAALLRSNVEVARQTLEKSAHESSSNDVILVFVLGCCCPCLATLTQKRSNNKPTSPLHQNLRTI